MTRPLLTLITVAFAVMFSACDVIENPIQDPNIDPGDTTKTVKQNVLLEDYTGHLCGNCPEAADRAHQIQQLYGKDRVIVIGVHAGPFARVSNPDYPTDWKSPEGIELDATFGISRAGNPNGLVNRTPRNGKFILSQNDWAPAVTEALTQAPSLGITAETSWDAASRTVTADVELQYLKTGAPDYYLVGYVIENGLVGDQLDYRANPSHIEDFEFEHVLRAAMNGTWGEQVATEAPSAGAKVQKQLTYTFPSAKDWKPENCELVIFVHRYQNPDTKEIVQVISVPVIAK